MSESTHASVMQHPPSAHPSFKLIREVDIASLHVRIEEYEHLSTGARHLHLKSDNDENVFLVALKTVPHDNTGVAHILEHTALCGSERYPVRDPFFMMIRRSLNSFMNAFTSSDWTAYPFASKNKKDFNNLLQVYLDSVFFANLDPLDFAQEGHRLDFEKEGDANSNLVYKGVVYNEMKGAMSSPVSQLWQTVTKYVFPTTTYHFNSGGDPEHITDLGYEDLLAFYKKHYHPSNALFLTYGDIPAQEHHEYFETLALGRFSKLKDQIRIPDEKRYFSPLKVEESYPCSESEGSSNKTHIVMAWLLGHSFNLEENLEAHLLANVLFENSAAPLQKALEQCEFAHAPSPLCGLEDSNREMTFICGIEGSDPEHAVAFEQRIESVLRKVMDDGVAHERLEAVLHQLELSQREVSGDHYPYGLSLILGALSPMIHGGDPVALLDLDPVLVRLRERIKDPEYIKGLARKLLIENSHRVTLVMKPDHALETSRSGYIRQQLQARKGRMSDADRQEVLDLSEKLKQRQQQKDDESILPKVGIEDVPHDIVFPVQTETGEAAITAYAKGTNGLVYQQIIINLPEFSERELGFLPIYASLLTELGCGELSYLEMQNCLSSSTGGIGAHYALKGAIDNEQRTCGALVLSGKALAANSEKLAELMKTILLDVRFDEHDRIRELIAQIRTRKEQSVTSSGHALAMSAASSGMSPVANLGYRLSGLAGIKEVKRIDDQLHDSAELAAVACTLGVIHKKVMDAERRFLVVAENESIDRNAQVIRSLWSNLAVSPLSDLALPEVRSQVNIAWSTNTQVSFCAKSYPTVPVDHEDAPALTVLGGFLRNGYLHRAIREQGGAYGGGASQDSGTASFRFYSYRDPRLTETLTDFDASIEWMLNHPHEALALEEAILGVVSQIDKPKSPAGDAKSDYHSGLFGRDAEQRKRFRSRILKVTLEDLLRVTRTYLNPENASIGLVTSKEMLAELTLPGLEIHEL